MKLVLLPLLLAAVAFGDDTCPSYAPWMSWTDKCLWFPFDAMREDMVNACDVIVDGLENLPTFPPPPEGFPSEQCGHCSFKFRCRKRAQTDDCPPMDGEIQHCHDGTTGDICTMPQIVRPHYNLGCKYAIVPYMLQQCSTRPDVPEWRRRQARRFADVIPKFHCRRDGDACKCCCHPYVPNADGSACEMKSEPSCDPFSDWNGWSDKCLFFPPDQMKEDFKEHCNVDMPKPKGPEPPAFSKLKLPPGMELPGKCGFCSFKVRCRTRSMQSAAGKKECFPLDVEKMVCGNEQCEGCGEVCDLPKIGGDCDYNKKIMKIVEPAIKSRMRKMPAHMRHHLIKLVTGMPHGKCVEADGKCKCCCHPYEPSADGSTCELKEICKTPEEMGVEVDLNLADDDSFKWLW